MSTHDPGGSSSTAGNSNLPAELINSLNHALDSFSNENLDRFRAKMDAFLQNSLENVGKNNTYMPIEKYSDIVSYLKDPLRLEGKSKVKNKDFRKWVDKKKGFALINDEDMNLVDVLAVPKKGIEKSTCANDYRRVARTDELFDIVWKAHACEVGHLGAEKVTKKLNASWSNINRDYIREFCTNCPACQTRVAMNKNEERIRPIIESEWLGRCQCDVIDMRSNPDGVFEYILHHVDHFGKFRFLIPLERATREHIAEALMRHVICVIGPHKIFHSDNGQEFLGALLPELHKQFGRDTLFVRGAPRHSQSQGCVERGNRTVQDLIGKMNVSNSLFGNVDVLQMIKDKAKEHGHEGSKFPWVSLLPYIQYNLNTTVSSATGKTPYEIVFGIPPPSGTVFPGARTGVVDEDDISPELLPGLGDGWDIPADENNVSNSEESNPIPEGDPTDMPYQFPTTLGSDNSQIVTNDGSQTTISIDKTVPGARPIPAPRRTRPVPAPRQSVNKPPMSSLGSEHVQSTANGPSLNDHVQSDATTTASSDTANTDLTSTDTPGDDDLPDGVQSIADDGSHNNLIGGDITTTAFFDTSNTHLTSTDAPDDYPSGPTPGDDSLPDNVQSIANGGSHNINSTGDTTATDSTSADTPDNHNQSNLTSGVATLSDHRQSAANNNGSNRTTPSTHTTNSDSTSIGKPGNITPGSVTQREKQNTMCDRANNTSRVTHTTTDNQTTTAFNHNDPGNGHNKSNDPSNSVRNASDNRHPSVPSGSENSPVDESLTSRPVTQKEVNQAEHYLESVSGNTSNNSNPQLKLLGKKVAYKKNVSAEALAATRKQAAKMIKAQSKKSKKKVHTFNEGDHVTVKIPIKLRTTSDPKRLPCKVTTVHGITSKLYTVTSQYGTLSKRVTSSELNSFTGAVRDPPADSPRVSLEAAVKQFLSHNKFAKTKCKCHGKCVDNRCSCKQNGITCSTKCHPGEDCENVEMLGSHNDSSDGDDECHDLPSQTDSMPQSTSNPPKKGRKRKKQATGDGDEYIPPSQDSNSQSTSTRNHPPNKGRKRKKDATCDDDDEYIPPSQNSDGQTTSNNSRPKRNLSKSKKLKANDVPCLDKRFLETPSND